MEHPLNCFLPLPLTNHQAILEYGLDNLDIEFFGIRVDVKGRAQIHNTSFCTFDSSIGSGGLKLGVL
jgi:hypothetical protein